MNHHPHYTCDESGVTVRNESPPTGHPRNFKDHPMKFSVHRDRTLELSGEHFTTRMQLSIDEALGLAMLLLYTLREEVYLAQLPPTQFTEVRK
jgi:hypothetical protein